MSGWIYDKMTIEIDISCRLDTDTFTWKDLGFFYGNELIKFDEEQLNALFVNEKYTIKEKARNDECHSQESLTMTFGPSTLKEHMQNILEFEKVHRPTRMWFGKLDESHVYYEGLYKNKDGTFEIIMDINYS